MIDLRKPLPRYLVCNGREYAIKTDWRTWYAVQIDVECGFPIGLETGIFVDEVPVDFAFAASEFLASPNKYPQRSHSDVKAISFFDDGDYIYAAFRQAYGINLAADDMHWHEFMALLRGLPENTMLAKIMGYRGFRAPSNNDTQIKAMERERSRWEIIEEEEEDEFDRQFREDFCNTPGVNDG